MLLLIREHFLLENMENVREIQENVVFNNYTEDDETRMWESIKRNIIEEPQLTASAFQN